MILDDLFELRDGSTYRKGGATPLENNKPGSNGYIIVAYVDMGMPRYLALHRLKFYLLHGYLPKVVDHKNGTRLENAQENLRPATHKQNLWNTQRALRHLPRGVTSLPNGKFRARVGVDGKGHHIGVYATAEAASLAVETFLRNHHGEFYRPQKGQDLG